MSAMHPLENETASAEAHRPDDDGRPRGGAEQPLFLLGAARSGTSLIYKALCMHPQAAWISNWVRTYPAASVLAAANRIPRRFPEIQRRVWFGEDSNAYVYGRRRPLLDRAFPMPVEGEPIFARLDAATDNHPTHAGTSEERRARSLRRKIGSIRRFAGAPTFVSKRIGNNRRVSMLMAAFPQARFLDLIRDGRAVAYSLSRVDWWPDTVPWWHHQSPRAWEAEGGNAWELCARDWVEEVGVIESGLRDVPVNQTLHLSYEGLIQAPVESLRRVATFAGLAPTDGWLDRVARLDFPDRNDGWRRKLTPASVATIEEIQRDTLIRHGYPV